MPSATGFTPNTPSGSPTTGPRRWGGPRAYSQAIGDETTVVRMHSGKGSHEEMDRRAIACFDQALTDVGFDTDDLVRGALRLTSPGDDDHDARATDDSEDDVPDGLAIPRWSWDGLIES